MKIDTKIKMWVSQLDEEEMEQVLIDSLKHLIDMDDIILNDNSAPYWRDVGTPLLKMHDTCADLL